MAICYLIGTNHAHQFEGQKDGNSVAFACFLCRFCSDNHIDLLAEELNEDAIVEWKVSGSVARSVALKLSIPHLFCDINRADRHRLGVLTDQEIAQKLGFGSFWTRQQVAQIDAEVRKAWFIRENFWLGKLHQSSFNRCAFILGAKHVPTFEALLNSQGFTVHVAQTNWGAIPDKVKL